MSGPVILTWVVVWVAIGAGWLWFFKRRSADNRFRRVAVVPSPRVRRPLSVTVIGIYMLFGACLMPINIFMRAPAFLMGMDFSGWKAAIFFPAMGTLDAVIGIGLLRLARWSRMAAIYFFLFRIANTLLTFLVPGNRVRFEEGVAAMQTALGEHATRRAPTWFGPVVEISVMSVVLWFLFTARDAFLLSREGPPPAL